MKITEVRTLIARSTIKNWVVVKVMTDEGVYGLGDATVGNKALTCAACVQDMARLLIGQDPHRIQQHWQTLRMNAMAAGNVIDTCISGIDMALWDILGKSLGVPVYQLLGGPVRDRIQVYASGFSQGARSLDELKAKAVAAVEKGYSALKFSPIGPRERAQPWQAGGAGNTDGAVLERTYWKAAVDRVRAVREAVGDEVDVGLDFHCRLSPHESTALIKMVEPYRPWFVEEPCQPEDIGALAQISASTWVPIASGEKWRTKHGFHEVVSQRACSIVQPDPHCGGVFELRLIAAMAEARYMSVIPHQAASPINTAAALQFAACTPNVLCVEHFEHAEGFLTEPLVVKEGYIDLPTRPGLGVDLNEAVVQAHPYEPVDFPVWRREDGTVTMW